MLCHPEPGSAVSYALQNAKSHIYLLFPIALLQSNVPSLGILILQSGY